MTSNDLPVVIKMTPVGADSRKLVVRRQVVLRSPKSTVVLTCVVEGA